MSGELPEGWSVKPLGEIADLIMGQSPPSSAVAEVGDGLPFIQGNAEFGARHPTPKFIASTTPKVVREGDVLISVRAPVGEVNIAEGPLCIGRGVGGIRAKDCDPDFLFYAVCGLSQTFDRLSQGSTFDAINGKELRSIEILLPPLDEQRRIAEVLRSVDEALASYDDVAKTVANVVQRLSSHYFIDPTIYDGPHPLGSFGDLFDIKGGSQPPKSTFVYEPKPGFVRLLQIRDFERDDKAAYIPEGSSGVRCREDDILIARYGASVGRILTGKAGAYNVALTKVVLRGDRINRRYAYHWLKSDYFQNRIAAVSGRSAQAGFNKEDLFPTKVVLPPHEEQGIVADTLDDLEKQAVLVEKTRDAVLALKSSLLSDLVSGRVRVPA